jgi:hypothetical protein
LDSEDHAALKAAQAEVKASHHPRLITVTRQSCQFAFGWNSTSPDLPRLRVIVSPTTMSSSLPSHTISGLILSCVGALVHRRAQRKRGIVASRCTNWHTTSANRRNKSTSRGKEKQAHALTLSQRSQLWRGCKLSGERGHHCRRLRRRVPRASVPYRHWRPLRPSGLIPARVSVGASRARRVGTTPSPRDVALCGTLHDVWTSSHPRTRPLRLPIGARVPTACGTCWEITTLQHLSHHRGSFCQRHRRTLYPSVQGNESTCSPVEDAARRARKGTWGRGLGAHL